MPYHLLELYIETPFFWTLNPHLPFLNSYVFLSILNPQTRYPFIGYVESPSPTPGNKSMSSPPPSKVATLAFAVEAVVIWRLAAAPCSEKNYWCSILHYITILMSYTTILIDVILYYYIDWCNSGDLVPNIYIYTYISYIYIMYIWHCDIDPGYLISPPKPWGHWHTMAYYHLQVSGCEDWLRRTEIHVIDIWSAKITLFLTSSPSCAILFPSFIASHR